MGRSDFSTEDKKWLAAWLHETTAIDVRESQDHLWEARLARVARDHDLELHGLLERLRMGDARLSAAAADAMTTNETSWFRDIKPFTFISDEFIPQFMRETPQGVPLRVWSAGCSNGQELYSVAIAISETCPELLRERRTLLWGTDVSGAAVQRAREGRYSQAEVDRGLPARYLVRYFTQEGRDWVVSENLRAATSFTRHNLASGALPGTFDLILCRYALIYFNEETRAKVLQTLSASLAPQGVLLLGASEMGGKHAAHLNLEMRNGVALYTKRPEANP